MRFGLVFAIGAALHGQTTVPDAPRKAFDVASLKSVIAPASDYSVTMRQGPGVLSYPLINLKSLIMEAYRVKDSQIAGPDWLNTENYSLDARFPPTTSEKDLALMLQTLLAERFGLRLHREMRAQNSYALLPGKDKFKLQPVEPGESSQMTNPSGHALMKKTPLADLAEWLSSQLEYPVEDMTGIPGVYDIKLDWLPEGAVSTNALPSLTGAVEELGLKLERRRNNVQFLVIDHVEKTPVAN